MGLEEVRELGVICALELRRGAAVLAQADGADESLEHRPRHRCGGAERPGRRRDRSEQERDEGDERDPLDARLAAIAAAGCPLGTLESG